MTGYAPFHWERCEQGFRGDAGNSLLVQVLDVGLASSTHRFSLRASEMRRFTTSELVIPSERA